MGIEIGSGIVIQGGVTLEVIPAPAQNITTETDEVLLTESSDDITTE
jgi:hypothetical protein